MIACVWALVWDGVAAIHNNPSLVWYWLTPGLIAVVLSVAMIFWGLAISPHPDGPSDVALIGFALFAAGLVCVSCGGAGMVFFLLM